MRILIVHGIGYQEKEAEEDRRDGRKSWIEEWQDQIKSGFRSARINLGTEPEFSILEYDNIFYRLPELTYTSIPSIFKMLVEEVWRRSGKYRTFDRHWFDLPEEAQKTIGMIVHYISNQEVRNECNKYFEEEIKKSNPDLIFAHSLGSIIAYNYFISQKENTNNPKTILVTFGSQIAHPKISQLFGGCINAPKNLKYWINLYNSRDQVCVEPIKPANKANNFCEKYCGFDQEIKNLSTEGIIEAFINHSGDYYLNKDYSNFYKDLKVQLDFHLSENYKRIRALIAPRKNKKALIVGINEYPDSRDALDGCVNDSFLMSQVLQEFGFESSNIRMLLNSRATSDAIFERLEWLLEDAEEGDERVFYYSGHGTQIPARNFDYELDHLLESLVPYNFDFDNPYETGIIDKRLSRFYSNLNYKVNFTIILDCCHSGGMDKAGSGKVKSIRLPDDIRHRLEEWKQNEGWQKKKLNPYFEENSKYQSYAGLSGNTHLLGRALSLRNPNDSIYKTNRELYGHLGPYLPIIFEACLEDELAQETKIGSVSHGIFTYHFARVLREAKTSGFAPTLAQIKEQTVKLVSGKFKYQNPRLVAPSEKLNQAFSWQVGGK